MSKSGPKNRRTNILSYPAAQIRMVLVFAALAAIYATVNFCVSRQALVRFASQIRSEVVAPDKVHDVDVVLQLNAHDLDIQLGIITVLSFVMLCLACLAISHRLAGPIYHLRKYMSDILDGTVDKRHIKFRKNDFFHDCAVVFNNFQDHFLKDYAPGNPPESADKEASD